MKLLRALIALLVAVCMISSVGAQSGRRLLLMGGGTPQWLPTGHIVGVNFQTNQGYIAGVGYVPLASLVTTVNTIPQAATARLLSLLTPSHGTVYTAYYSTPTPPGGVWSYNDNTASNRIDLRSNQNGTEASAITVSGVGQSFPSVGTIGASSLFVTSALSWTAGAQQIAANGLVSSDAPASIPPSPSILQFKSMDGGAQSNPLNNNILIWSYSPNASSPSQAQALSSLNYASLAGNTIVAWGDSLTAGNEDGSGISYPGLLPALFTPNIPVLNQGIGGQTSTQITARFLATPYLQNYRGVIWSGRNNSSQTATVQSDIAVMYAKMPAGLVLSVLNGEGEGSGSGSVYTNIVTTLNPALSSTYSTHYLDVRSMLVAQTAANAVDVLDKAADIPLFSLRAKYPGTIVGAITSGTTSFSITGSSVAPGFIIQASTEYIYVLTGSGTSVTSCTRGYAGTTAAGYGAGQAMTATDNLHLGANGYTLVAGWVYTALHSLGWG